jgi:hypothetical protein
MPALCLFTIVMFALQIWVLSFGGGLALLILAILPALGIAAIYETVRSYAGIWVTRPDQAARFSVSFAATPSVNVTPSMTLGNWFAPFSLRHVFAAA